MLKNITISENIEEQVSSLPPNPLIVSDDNTYQVLAKRLESAFKNSKSLVLRAPKPDFKNIGIIKEQAENCDYIIAVGSGTINDLCKYASFSLGTKYAVFPTAPSMNGYISANASLIKEGQKTSFPAHLPDKVIVDLEVVSNAPLRLIQSGIGDSICRSTAQADWLLSHLVKGTDYNEEPFELLKPYEEKFYNAPSPYPPPLKGGRTPSPFKGEGWGGGVNSNFIKSLINRNKQAIKILMEMLFASGWGMYICGGSYPASQGEHMIAHTMEKLTGENNSFHGEQIGITTLTMARLQERIIQKGQIPSDIAEKIAKVMVPSETIEEILKTAKNPIKPEDIGWDRDKYKEAIKLAPTTRDRFTFLNLNH